ncbi:MAG: glycosyltransferase family 4 protein [Deltaproteobacteria bacterium]|nr:MAG: glycosyltransferase family 4 protein [Deltaproteobacteria bacterium]
MNNNSIKKRILFISHRVGLSGSENSLYTLLKNIDSNKLLPIVVVPGDGPLVEKLSRLSIMVYTTQQGQWVGHLGAILGFIFHFPRRFIKMYKFVKNNRIELIYSNTELSPLGALVAYVQGIPHVWHMRMYLNHIPDLGLKLLPARLLFYIIIKLSKYIIANSKIVASQFKGLNTNGKLFVIYNGVDLNNRPLPDVQKLISWEDGKSISIGEIEEKIISVVGYIGPYRCQEDAINALPIIVKRTKSIKLVIIGDADQFYLRYLIRLTENLGIRQHVFFSKPIKDILSFLSRCYLVLIPAQVGAYGRVAIEAMSQGIPVIGSDIQGSEEVIIDGVTGYLHRFSDYEDIAEKCTYLLDMPHMRDEMGMNAKKFFEERFTAEIYTKEVENVLLKALYDH